MLTSCLFKILSLARELFELTAQRCCTLKVRACCNKLHLLQANWQLNGFSFLHSYSCVVAQSIAASACQLITLERVPVANRRKLSNEEKTEKGCSKCCCMPHALSSRGKYTALSAIRCIIPQHFINLSFVAFSIRPTHSSIYYFLLDCSKRQIFRSSHCASASAVFALCLNVFVLSFLWNSARADATNPQLDRPFNYGLQSLAVYFFLNKFLVTTKNLACVVVCRQVQVCAHIIMFLEQTNRVCIFEKRHELRQKL